MVERDNSMPPNTRDGHEKDVMAANAPLLDWNAKKWEKKNQFMYSHVGSNVWPWFHEVLDQDTYDALNTRGFSSGRVVDIGTCSGYQAIELAAKGYDVVGTEVSTTALEDAEKNAARLLPGAQNLKFIVDDIADSALGDDDFDIVLDRGCFHSICCFAAQGYIRTLQRIMKDDGIALIKSMSSAETRFVSYDRIGDKKLPMPYHFKREELENFFGKYFSHVDVFESFFYSKNVDAPAKAWLTVLRK